jgi:iron complex outermembrane recepter protein
MVNVRSWIGFAALAAAVFLAFAARPCLAEEEGYQIEEVVVTAQRRAEPLQTTPIAITALSADTLNKAGVTDFAGVAESSTSLNFTPYPSSSNTLILYMRGQGVADPNQITQDGSVGLYEDGFYISRPQAETFDLADVDRVEVLRGPQGTLYGRNTTGGAVNIITRKPTGTTDYKLSVDGGTRGYVRALGVMDTPTIAGGLSGKVILLFSNLGGNVHNSSGEEDYNRSRQKGYRAALRWDDGGPFTADYFFEWGEIDSTPVYYQNSALGGLIPGYPATNELASNTWEPLQLPLSVARTDADGLTLAWQPNDSITVKSLTGYRGLDSRFVQNYAGALSNPATAAFTGVLNSVGGDIVQSHQLTQEFQLVGGIGKVFNYVAGLYYFDEHANHAQGNAQSIPTVLPGPPAYLPYSLVEERYVTADAKSKAAYVQGTWSPDALNNRLSLTLGGRYTKDNRNATRDDTSTQTITLLEPGIGILPFSTTATEVGEHNSLAFSKFNPAGTLSMAWTTDINTYLRIATAYKAGGSSEADKIGAFGTTFGPENVTTYELGLKSYWLEHRLRANIAAFHSDFKDMQLQFNVDATNVSIVHSQNAGKAKVDGAELELLLVPVNDFSLGINYTYLHTSIDQVTALAGTIFDPAVNPASPYHVGQNISSLFRLPFAPDNVVDLTADWTMLHATQGNLELSLNYRHQSRLYNTATTGPGVPGSTEFYSISPYGVLDGRLTWNFTVPENKSLRLSLWGKNITNEKYPLSVIGLGSSVLVPTPGTPMTGYTYQAVAWAPKAMVGVQIQYGY